MTSAEFRLWRKGLGLSQQGAAKLLGLPDEAVARYELKCQRGQIVRSEIPRLVELACEALSLQRSLFRELKMLESCKIAAGDERLHRLRNQLFDVNVFLSSRSRE